MKTFITFLISLMLCPVILGQSYQDGMEYQAQKHIYRCRYRVAVSDGIHFYGFTNTKNILEDMDSKVRGYESPKFDSELKLLELLYEVYGGKEKMQLMGSESISLYYYVGMDFTVKELRISFRSYGEEKLKTTIFQVEAIENLVKERIQFTFDRKSPLYREAVYTIFSASKLYTISKIPELLEKMR